MGPKCRLCAETRDDTTTILDDLDLTSKILYLFQVRISIEDKLPTNVCGNCRDGVNTTWEFHERIQKAQQLLVEEEYNHDASPDEDTKEENLHILTECLEDEIDLPDEPEKNVKRLRSGNVRAKKKEVVKLGFINQIAKSNREELQDGLLEIQPQIEGWDSYPWSCCDCNLKLNNVDELKDHHTNIHGQPAKYMCADCPKLYAKYSTFITHVRTHRQQLKLCCDLCGKWFETFDSQESHRATHCDKKLYSCMTCGKRFRMQSSLLVHTRSHLPLEVKNKHQCDQCPKRFGTKPNLMTHKRIHSGIREFTCDQCGKSFVQKGNLDNHMLTHTMVRPFSCLTCGKAFKTAVRLRKHSSVHSGVKPHHCEVCGRQFRERGTLKEHQRIHTGVMPFTCEFCGKSFRFKGVLTTHRRQHTGERPYSCLECQHHFTNWPNYNKHMKRRHGINTSVTVRKPQTIPPTGMPQRNPPGTVLAPPQPIGIIQTTLTTEAYSEPTQTFYPVFNFLPEELIPQRI